jgi:hypothetical protein
MRDPQPPPRVLQRQAAFGRPVAFEGTEKVVRSRDDARAGKKQLNGIQGAKRQGFEVFRCRPFKLKKSQNFV